MFCFALSFESMSEYESKASLESEELAFVVGLGFFLTSDMAFVLVYHCNNHSDFPLYFSPPNLLYAH